jgi:hypothetical protein
MGLAVRHKDHRHNLTEAAMKLDIVRGYDTFEGRNEFEKALRGEGSFVVMATDADM